MRLRGKVAIVTGGASGLGKEYASCLYREGCRVVISDIKDGTDAARSIDERGGEAFALQVDVTDEKAVEAMARTTVERFGSVDILINNAALTSSTGITRKPFHEIKAEEWDAVMAVNLKGTFLCCRAVYPVMRKQGRGKIINVTSGTFFKGAPFYLHYVTSKGGIVGLTRALAREVGEYGICVNAISPGLTITDTLRERSQYSGEFKQTMIDSRSIKREAVPGDLMGTILFLASGDSDFITGQTIEVDGGSYMH